MFVAASRAGSEDAMFSASRKTSDDDAGVLRSIVQRHFEATGSARAEEILERWDHYLPMFWKVVPHPARGKQQSTVLAAKVQAPRSGIAPRG